MTDRAVLEASDITPDQAAALIRGRRSVDTFENTAVAPALVREAIDLARWAPNHHLTQPWRFYRIGKATKTAIVELNSRLVAARKGTEVADAKHRRWQAVPGWLAVTCERNEDRLTAREDYAACACAIQNLVLYLHSAGVACKWTSGEVTRTTDFLALLGAEPEREYCVGLIWYGYPKRRPRSQRMDLDAILFECP